MGIWAIMFGKHGHRKTKEIEELLEVIKVQEQTELEMAREIYELTKIRPRRFIAFFSIQSFNKSPKNFIMGINLTVGQPGEVLSIQIYDSATGNVLSQAIGSAQQYAVDNAGIASIAPDAAASTSEDISPVAAGSANVTGQVTADLSAYGLGSAVVIQVDPLAVTVAPAAAPVIVPAARLVAAPLPAPVPAS